MARSRELTHMNDFRRLLTGERRKTRANRNPSARSRMENHMSQQDDPKGVENAENTGIARDDLDQISGGAFDTF